MMTKDAFTIAIYAAFFSKLRLECQDRDQFPRSGHKRNFSARDLLLGEYIFWQIWIVVEVRRQPRTFGAIVIYCILYANSIAAMGFLDIILKLKRYRVKLFHLVRIELLCQNFDLVRQCNNDIGYLTRLTFTALYTQA